MFYSRFKQAQTWFFTSTLLLAAGCPTDEEETPEQEAISCQDNQCDVYGPLVDAVTFESDKVYTLRSAVYVGSEDGSERGTLTIEPGTLIKGDTSTLTFLAVGRGSKIEANGTADNPIVFTSAKEAGSRAPGDWGGLIINGAAPSNQCPDLNNCDVQGEGGGGTYGGTVTDDSSGSMKYVRIEFGGKQITDENELNGIAFQGVGSSTVIENIHIHQSKDDGVEFFGGNVNVKNMILTCIGDDSIDWTNGWSGKAQFVLVRQCEGDGDNGIEADSNSTDTATPRSNPTLSNLTLVGHSKTDYGMLLRVGTAGQIWNSVVTNFGETCVGVDGDNTFAQATSNQLVLKNNLIHCPSSTPFCDARQVGDGQDCTTASLDHSATETLYTSQASNLSGEDPKLANLGDPSSLDGLDLRPAGDSPAQNIGAGPTDAFFTPVTYAGAFEPGGANWASWTSYPSN